jgi:hypothetical protein
MQLCCTRTSVAHELIFAVLMIDQYLRIAYIGCFLFVTCAGAAMLQIIINGDACLKDVQVSLCLRFIKFN